MPSPVPSITMGPDWVVAEMPPGYQNRVAEIQRLTADLEEMGRFARLLTEAGAPLASAVRDLFAALHCEIETGPHVPATGVVVRLPQGRLLLHCAQDTTTVERKSPEIAHVFQLLHEIADERDHVVLVSNAWPDRAPAERGESMTADAAAFIGRMGVSLVTGPALFAVWKLSLQEPERAREQVGRLHAHDGGVFETGRLVNW